MEQEPDKGKVRNKWGKSQTRARCGTNGARTRQGQGEGQMGQEPNKGKVKDKWGKNQTRAR